jgi:hypothetical protein
LPETTSAVKLLDFFVLIIAEIIIEFIFLKDETDEVRTSLG